MIYDGKLASEKIQLGLSERIEQLSSSPILAIVSVGSNPATLSFVKIKRSYAQAIGVSVKEFIFPMEDNEAGLVSRILDLSESGTYDGIVVQLPLPPTYDTRRVLEAIPTELDVDVLNSRSIASFKTSGTPTPPVAGAVAHIIHDTGTNLIGKNVVIAGNGILVGAPVATWFTLQGSTPTSIDIETDEETKTNLLKEADVVVSGTGVARMIRPEQLKKGVVLIDAGTSEQDGTLSGDCDPACAGVAEVFTPVPGGVGPLTVAYLFHNLIEFAEKRSNKI